VLCDCRSACEFEGCLSPGSGGLLPVVRSGIDVSTTNSASASLLLDATGAEALHETCACGPVGRARRMTVRLVCRVLMLPSRWAP
jgi:hypothetical protein